MKNKEYHTYVTVSKSNRKLVERGKLDTPDTQIHNHSLFCLDTGTSIENGGVKLMILHI
jgi:hypothetical protein